MTLSNVARQNLQVVNEAPSQIVLTTRQRGCSVWSAVASDGWRASPHHTARCLAGVPTHHVQSGWPRALSKRIAVANAV